MIHSLAVLVALALFAAGCQSHPKPRDFTPTVPRLFLEAANADGLPVTLPQSGVHIAVNAKPVLTEGDIANAELVQVELGTCVLFQLTPAATRDFYRLSVTHQGRRLVLVVDDAPLGARRIDGPITNGGIFMFVELPDAALPAFVANLKKSSRALQQEIERKNR